MKKVIFIFGMGLMALASAANAGSRKTSDAKTTEAIVATVETKTADATAYYQYDGPQPATTADLNDEDNYNDTQVNPNAVCGTSGNKGCAAEFTVSGSTHTGAPITIRVKP